ncbi:MAG TPA: hypothetical protein VM099_02920 [Gemmatimonadaceae bacterium]|nr:hypothetical protein [Gemmatimonadaceae bacterium]
MTDELKFPNPNERHVTREPGSLDERSVRAIHDIYLPPVESQDVYWSAMEARIMAGVQTADRVHEQSSLSILNSWAQIGLVAATALLAVGGVISNRLGEPDEQATYESVVSSAPDVISTRTALMTAADKSEQRDAALQYVLSY